MSSEVNGIEYKNDRFSIDFNSDFSVVRVSVYYVPIAFFNSLIFLGEALSSPHGAP